MSPFNSACKRENAVDVSSLSSVHNEPSCLIAETPIIARAFTKEQNLHLQSPAVVRHGRCNAVLGCYYEYSHFIDNAMLSEKEAARRTLEDQSSR